jgi:hypothetical protein
MACRGGHVAITAEQRAQLEALPNGDDRYFFCVDEQWDAIGEEFRLDLDKAWDGIHRCLAQGTPNSRQLDTEWGTYPLNLPILGGKDLCDDPEYLVFLIEPAQIRDLNAAMREITEERFAQLYWKHCEGAWPEYGEEDLGYCWAYFQEMRDFFARVEPTGRTVVFTADQ